MADKIDELLKSFEENRDSLHEMVGDIEEFKKHMAKLLPDKIDYRSRFVWEEKMKTISTILGTELSIRKQIDDSIKNEINIRTKMDVDDTDQGRDFYESLSKLVSEGKITVDK